MPFISYDSLLDMYPDGQMNENIQTLMNFDEFHCLLAGSDGQANAVKQRVADLPEDFLKWLDVCGGGMLFDTAMLTTKAHDDELDLDFETYASYYNTEYRKDVGIPDEWFIFASAIHSDVFFFDQGKKDGKVYQWDVEEHEIYKSWSSFEDWLTAQIDDSVSLIADEELEPLDIKLEVESDE